jgi:hypothetical protein
MTEIEKAIKHFENMRDENLVALDAFKKEIESGKVQGSTILYDNRHLYYSLALEALREKAEREKGCEYCNGDVLKYCGIKNSLGSPSVVLFGGTAKPKPEEKFKCCPECGRKLGERNG